MIKFLLVFIFCFQLAFAQTAESIDLKKQEEAKQISETDSTFNISIPSNGNSKELGLLVIMVVGTVILVSWVPYTGILFYQRFKEDGEFKDNHLLNLQQNFFVGDTEFRDGHLSTLKYTYLTSKKDPKNKKQRKLGLNVEVGYFDFTERDSNLNRSVKYHSPFWLIGPSVVFGNSIDLESGIYGKIDLTAGTSFKRDVNLILKAEMSLNYKFKNNYSVAFGVGDTYINGQKSKGIITRLDKFNLNVFSNLGFQF